jgi:hypothetical protein
MFHSDRPRKQPKHIHSNLHLRLHTNDVSNNRVVVTSICHVTAIAASTAVVTVVNVVINRHQQHFHSLKSSRNTSKMAAHVARPLYDVPFESPDLSHAPSTSPFHSLVINDHSSTALSKQTPKDVPDDDQRPERLHNLGDDIHDVK